jgi:hypothetical protein
MPKAKESHEGFDVPNVEQTEPAPEAAKPVSAVVSIPAPSLDYDEDATPVVKIDLPPGLGESIALLERLTHTIASTPEGSRKQQRENAQKLKVVRAHVFKLQQVPDAPPINANDYRESPTVERFAAQIRKAHEKN